MRIGYCMKKIVIFVLLVNFFNFYLYADDIPKEIKDRGFSEDRLISYNKEGTEEYFTFTDPEAIGRGDTVTFIVIDGKVDQVIRGEELKTLQYSTSAQNKWSINRQYS